ncbi:MAG: carbohydrate ABC transporter permease [Bacillota bacterium]|nr:carbohydrate ABC transporter permease [Bacillota bacterium]
MKNLFLLWPREFTINSYLLSIKYKMLWIGYGNTILRVLMAVPISLAITLLSGYALSHKTLPLRKTISMMLLIAMLFSGGLIPNYLLVNGLGLMDSRWALVLPGALTVFHIFLARNFFLSLPDSLEESAYIDGASSTRIFLQIILPLSLPIIATLALFKLVENWNAWFDCMIYIQDRSKHVLQLVLRRIVILNDMDGLEAMMNNIDERSLYTGRQLQATVIVLSVAPMLIVYPFIQKYFVKGIMLGAVKG